MGGGPSKSLEYVPTAAAQAMEFDKRRATSVLEALELGCERSVAAAGGREHACTGGGVFLRTAAGSDAAGGSTTYTAFMERMTCFGHGVSALGLLSAGEKVASASEHVVVAAQIGQRSIGQQRGHQGVLDATAAMVGALTRGWVLSILPVDTSAANPLSFTQPMSDEEIAYLLRHSRAQLLLADLALARRVVSTRASSSVPGAALAIIVADVSPPAEVVEEGERAGVRIVSLEAVYDAGASASAAAADKGSAPLADPDAPAVVWYPALTERVCGGLQPSSADARVQGAMNAMAASVRATGATSSFFDGKLPREQLQLGPPLDEHSTFEQVVTHRAAAELAEALLRAQPQLSLCPCDRVLLYSPVVNPAFLAAAIRGACIVVPIGPMPWRLILRTLQPTVLVAPGSVIAVIVEQMADAFGKVGDRGALRAAVFAKMLAAWSRAVASGTMHHRTAMGWRKAMAPLAQPLRAVVTAGGRVTDAVEGSMCMFAGVSQLVHMFAPALPIAAGCILPETPVGRVLPMAHAAGGPAGTSTDPPPYKPSAPPAAAPSSEGASGSYPLAGAGAGEAYPPIVGGAGGSYPPAAGGAGGSGAGGGSSELPPPDASGVDEFVL